MGKPYLYKAFLKAGSVWGLWMMAFALFIGAVPLFSSAAAVKKFKKIPQKECQKAKSALSAEAKDFKLFKTLALCRAQKGKILSAWELLDRLVQDESLELSVKLSSARLQNELTQGRKAFFRLEALSLSRLVWLSPQIGERRKWTKKAEALIRALSVKDLRAYAKKASHFGLFEGFLLYTAGESFWAEKRVQQAEDYFRKALAKPMAPDLKKQAELRLKAMEHSSRMDPYLLGVLAPLSGRHKALGESVVRGLAQCLNNEGDSPWRLMVKDSKSHPPVAREEVRNLFFKHNVSVVAGGLLGETAKVLVEQAQDLHLPVVLFSQKEDLAKGGDFVFQNAAPAGQLLQPLVELARESLKAQKAALLFPDDFYGKEYARRFAEIFEQSGGQVVKKETYKSGEADFKKHIKNLLELNIKGREKEYAALKEEFLEKNPQLTARSPKLVPENLLPQKKDFSALFVPDSFHRMEKIIDHLKYFRVKDVYLLGTDLWTKERLPRKLPKSLPLVFPFIPRAEGGALSSFDKAWLKSYARPPGLFEQRACNAARFLKKALAQYKSRKPSRLALRSGLAKVSSFQGVYGEVSVSKEGVFEYPVEIHQTGEISPEEQ